MAKEPLYPHVPKKKEPLFPHVPRASKEPEVAYDKSLEEFRAASREFRLISEAYRAKTIGDEEYLKGRAIFNKAVEVADEAEAAFIKAKAIPKPKAAPMVSTAPISAADYWMAHLEYNALRDPPSGKGPDTDAGAFLAWCFEAAGDIIRETDKDQRFVAPDYVSEKFHRLTNNLHLRDWKDPLSPREAEALVKIRKDIEGLPADTDLLKKAKAVLLAIADRNTYLLKLQLEGLRPLLETALSRPLPQVFPSVYPGAEAQFIKVGERVRYIRELGRSRRQDWPEGAWLEYGVEGVVTEFRPGSPAVTVKGEHFEGIEPWAVVTWDNGGDTAIDAEEEGEHWERIGSIDLLARTVGGK